MTDRFETLAVHAGAEPDPETGAVVPAIQMSVTFKQDGVGGLRGGFEYGRSGNPTRAALEAAIATLENGTPRHRVRIRAGRDAGRRLPLRPGRPAADERRRLRRHVAAGRQGLAPLRDRDRSDRPPRPRRGRRGVRGREAASHGVDRDPVQPADEDHRHQCRGATGGRRRRAHGRRQHVRDALPPAATRARSRPRAATRPRSTSAGTRTSSAG